MVAVLQTLPGRTWEAGGKAQPLLSAEGAGPPRGRQAGTPPHHQSSAQARMTSSARPSPRAPSTTRVPQVRKHGTTATHPSPWMPGCPKPGSGAPGRAGACASPSARWCQSAPPASPSPRTPHPRPTARLPAASAPRSPPPSSSCARRAAWAWPPSSPAWAPCSASSTSCAARSGSAGSGPPAPASPTPRCPASGGGTRHPQQTSAAPGEDGGGGGQFREQGVADSSWSPSTTGHQPGAGVPWPSLVIAGPPLRLGPSSDFTAQAQR